MTAVLYIGDTRTLTGRVADGSVDLVVTSPPFLGLRDYLPDDDPQREFEIGHETDPAEFVDVLLALTAEWGRVLAPHGSICVELGDTYSGDRGKRKGRTISSRRDGISVPRQSCVGDGWPDPKSLCGIPAAYQLSLAYGRNVLTGNASPAGRWRVRNVLAWTRPNPTPGALGDKFRPATSYVTVATRSPDRWFDIDAVRTETAEWLSGGETERDRQGRGRTSPAVKSGSTAPPLDCHDDWQPFLGMSTARYLGAHSAVYPTELPKKMIEAMCPREVCVRCGEPRRRRVRNTDRYQQQRDTVGDFVKNDADGLNGTIQYVDGDRISCAERVTVGWTDCGCGAGWRRGVVLDPFAGSGTTLQVAEGCGRDSVGIELDRRNVPLIGDRVGMFLELAS